MTTDTSGARPGAAPFAVVLGGGGVAAIAWETGLALGLAEGGVNLGDAELLVGTSAGSVVATQIACGRTLRDLFAEQVDASSTLEPVIDMDLGALRQELDAIRTGSADPVEVLRGIGAVALRADRVPEKVRRAQVAARLLAGEWPHRALLVTAVDAVTGDFTVFTRASGVDLVDAVAASCAVPGVWPAVTIGGRRYMDGGMRSGVNADLAVGHRRVVVVEAAELAETADVKELGPESQVFRITPDEASGVARGANPLDPAVRPACARAGHAQGLQLAARLRAWLS
ncbi:patatin-like phospholipase family protein [Streptosporangium sp. NPDC051022]|uniref:patatin-like phospholipase family protein n=1 Tax=Streptosporangium sp. NPDC051022 TaxID=3155752 RepID=UPI003446A656